MHTKKSLNLILWTYMSKYHSTVKKKCVIAKININTWLSNLTDEQSLWLMNSVTFNNLHIYVQPHNPMGKIDQKMEIWVTYEENTGQYMT